jgi:hypothetical protein
MNKLSNVGKVVIVAIVAVILIVAAIVYGTGSNSGQNVAINSATSTGTNSPASTSTTPPTTPAVKSVTQGPAPVATVKITSPVIAFVTPVKNDIWKIAAYDDISWTKPGKISGSLSLIDGDTGQFIGVILPQVGPNQTSYTWNTRDLLLDRTSPLGKTVVPGTYKIRLSYDGNGIQPLTSPVFTITN